MQLLTRFSARAMVIALLVVLGSAAPAAAWQGEGGAHYCSGVILGFVHFKYNDIADVVPPGSTTMYLYRDNDSLWHTRERNGVGGGGIWEVDADPFLNLTDTWPGCRNFG
jgi:hypothetical protein